MYHTMIVDDEPLMRTYLAQSIPAFSALFDVSAVAKDGREAMELLKKSSVDVVITDIKMPEVDGLSLAKHIHENYPGITVIVISGFSDFEYAQKAIRYNVKDYLLKPLVDKTLIDLLDALAARFEQEKGTARFRMAGTGAKRDPLRHRLLCALLERDSARIYRLYRELREKGRLFMEPFACIAKFQCLYAAGSMEAPAAPSASALTLHMLLDRLCPQFGCMALYANDGSTYVMADARSEMHYLLPGQPLRLARRDWMYLSVFALGAPLCGVTLQGVYYPLQDATLTELDYPLGTSNEFTAPEACLQCTAGHGLVVLTRADG